MNCCSIRNKGPLIDDTIVSNNLDILALAETHIHISDTNSLLQSVTPPGFQLIHGPRRTGGGGVGFLTRKNLPAKTVDAPTHFTFENIVISIVTHSKSFVVACVYRTPGSCSSAFLDDFLFFCGFLSSLTPRHAPLICRRAKKIPAGWLSDSYHRAKSIPQCNHK